MNDLIVVGTDGSATANSAVKQAAALAKLSGGKLQLVSGYREEKSLDLSPGGPHTGTVAKGARTSASDRLEQAADRLRAEGVNVETHCVAGDPADAIIDVAETMGADLIVVGNKGMHSGRRFLLGSVPNKVSHHAPCSVMIVRTTD